MQKNQIVTLSDCFSPKSLTCTLKVLIIFLSQSGLKENIAIIVQIQEHEVIMTKNIYTHTRAPKILFLVIKLIVRKIETTPGSLNKQLCISDILIQSNL